MFSEDNEVSCFQSLCCLIEVRLAIVDLSGQMSEVVKMDWVYFILIRREGRGKWEEAKCDRKTTAETWVNVVNLIPGSWNFVASGRFHQEGAGINPIHIGILYCFVAFSHTSAPCRGIGLG